jgi:hypothetical protein
MEISSISGSDVIPTGFSSQAPRQEETQRNEEQPVHQTETSDQNRGTRIDTYA